MLGNQGQVGKESLFDRFVMFDLTDVEIVKVISNFYLVDGFGFQAPGRKVSSFATCFTLILAGWAMKIRFVVGVSASHAGGRVYLWTGCPLVVWFG